VSYNLTLDVKNCFKGCLKELRTRYICIQLCLALRFIFENGENNPGCC